VTDVVCLDAGVWVKALVAEDLSDQAGELLAGAVMSGRLVAPAFCWAEIGSVLRKKVRIREITADDAVEAWENLQAMPIEFVDTIAMRRRAWQLADLCAQPTLYDAAYLACAELTAGTFWTADNALLTALGDKRPPYVRDLHERVTRD
jgi:predicted nucleic acid-binding protein